jgi:hypothetical protein
MQSRSDSATSGRSGETLVEAEDTESLVTIKVIDPGGYRVDGFWDLDS